VGFDSSVKVELVNSDLSIGMLGPMLPVGGVLWTDASFLEAL
jgi:hypothetical protein